MPYLVGSALLYVACVVFFHADPRRTWLDALRTSARNRQIAWTAGGLLALISVAVLWCAAGLELAIAFWLGIATAVGSVSLWISALAKTWHVASGCVAAIIAVAGIGIWAAGGGAA